MPGGGAVVAVDKRVRRGPEDEAALTSEPETSQMRLLRWRV